MTLTNTYTEMIHLTVKKLEISPPPQKNWFLGTREVLFKKMSYFVFYKQHRKVLIGTWALENSSFKNIITKTNTGWSQMEMAEDYATVDVGSKEISAPFSRIKE